MCLRQAQLVNPINTPMEVVGGGLYLLFDLRVSPRGGNCCPNFAFAFGIGSKVKSVQDTCCPALCGSRLILVLRGCDIALVRGAPWLGELVTGLWRVAQST